jgi:predicted transcriptional regulator
MDEMEQILVSLPLKKRKLREIILEVMRTRPDLSQREIARALGCSRSAVYEANKERKQNEVKS